MRFSITRSAHSMLRETLEQNHVLLNQMTMHGLITVVTAQFHHHTQTIRLQAKTWYN